MPRVLGTKKDKIDNFLKKEKTRLVISHNVNIQVRSIESLRQDLVILPEHPVILSYKMAKRLCLVDDLKMLKFTMSNTSSRNKLNPEVNDQYNIFSRESQEYELKTKDEA
ncbi:hypothetical protein Tco_1546103 [Tanacetum coccineum]